MWRRNPGFTMTRSIHSILTGDLPSWTISRPPLFWTWLSFVAFLFRGGAKRASIGPFNFSFTGRVLINDLPWPINQRLPSFQYADCKRSAKKCVPGVHNVKEAVLFQYQKSKSLFARKVKIKKLLRGPILPVSMIIPIMVENLQVNHTMNRCYVFMSTHSRCFVTGFSGSSTTHANGDRKEESSGTNTSGTKRRKMADLRAFVETRLLSRSDKMLEKIDFKHAAQNNRTLLSAPDTVSSWFLSYSGWKQKKNHQIIL